MDDLERRADRLLAAHRRRRADYSVRPACSGGGPDDCVQLVVSHVAPGGPEGWVVRVHSTPPADFSWARLSVLSGLTGVTIGEGVSTAGGGAFEYRQRESVSPKTAADFVNIRVELRPRGASGLFQPCEALRPLMPGPIVSEAEAVEAIWEYAQGHQLLDLAKGATVHCDEALQGALGGCQAFRFSELRALLFPLLAVAPAIELDYRLDFGQREGQAAVDVRLAPRPVVEATVLPAHDARAQAEAQEKARLERALAESALRQRSLQALAADPCAFSRALTGAEMQLEQFALALPALHTDPRALDGGRVPPSSLQSPPPSEGSSSKRRAPASPPSPPSPPSPSSEGSNSKRLRRGDETRGLELEKEGKERRG